MRFLFLASLLLSTQAFAAPQTEDSRSSYFTTAWAGLPQYISFCQKDPACGLDSVQNELLVKILAHIAKEKPLIFTTEAEHPGLFSGAGVHRIAVTGDTVGSQIYINLNEIQGVDYGSVIAILTHELGHHFGIKDTEDRVLDILGAKVKQYFLKTTEKVDLGSFHQSQIGMMIINSADPAYNAANGSEVLLYDDQGVYNIDQDFRRFMPCPLTTKRQGGLIFSQLHESGLTDWEVRDHQQAAVFEFTMKQVCVSPTENSTLWSRIRLSAPMILPRGTPARADWWKTAKAVTDGNNSIIVIEIGSTHDISDNHGGIPLEIQKLNSPSGVKNGETLKITATVKTPMDLPIEGCTGFLSSKSFAHTIEKPRFKFNMSGCEFKKVAAQTYELKLSHSFPGVTPSRIYFLDSISLKVKGQDMIFLGLPDALEANNIGLQSTQEPGPFTIRMANLIYRDASGKATTADPNLDIYSGKVSKIPLQSIFGVTFYIESDSAISPLSALFGRYKWKMGEEDRMDDFDRPVVDSVGNWNFPFAGSTVVQKAPNDPRMTAFQLALRPYTLAKANNELHVLKSVNYHTFWLVNQNLQELYADLDFTIQPVP